MNPALARTRWVIAGALVCLLVGFFLLEKEFEK